MVLEGREKLEGRNGDGFSQNRLYASSQRIKIFKPGIVVQSYNLSAQEAKAG